MKATRFHPLRSASLLMIACSAAAWADDLTWNANVGDWHNPANWTPLGLPDGTDVVSIGGPAVVNITSADAFSHQVVVGAAGGQGVTVNVMNGVTWHVFEGAIALQKGRFQINFTNHSDTVNVIGGSTVHTRSTSIGHTVGGTGSGTLNILGPGSLWTDTATISVGGGGKGTLLVAGGGRVESWRGAISAGSNIGLGEATVTGAGSAWVMDSSLIVGDFSTGFLTVSDGGLVDASHVGVSLFSNGQGTIHLDGTAAARGEIRTGYLVDHLGTGALHFDGGILRAKADGELIRDFTPGSVTIGSGGAFVATIYDNTIPIGMTGTGGLTKTGGGTLELTGTNTYASTTQVLQGTLAVNGSLQGAGGVAVHDGATLQGTGGIAGTTEIYWGGRLSPGSSTGGLLAEDMVWHGGGEYLWEIDDLQHDRVSLYGTLDIQSDPGTPFRIGLQSLLADDPGSLVSWNPAIDQEWIILTTFGSIDGFDPTNFFVDDSGFAAYNDLAGGSFHLGVVDVPRIGGVAEHSNLVLYYTIPEPSAALLVAFGCLALGTRRKR